MVPVCPEANCSLPAPCRLHCLSHLPKDPTITSIISSTLLGGRVVYGHDVNPFIINYNNKLLTLHSAHKDRLSLCATQLLPLFTPDAVVEEVLLANFPTATSVSEGSGTIMSDLTNATVRSTNALFFRSTLLIINRFPWQQTDRSSLADPDSAVEAIALEVVDFCLCFDV